MKAKHTPTGPLTRPVIVSLYPDEMLLWERICEAHHPEFKNRPNRTGKTETFRELIQAEAKRLGLLEGDDDR